MTALADGVVSVPVRGGALAVEVSAGRTAPVLAVHGISSQRRLWDWLRAAYPGLTLVAPDLRGRADSVGLPGPFGLDQHVDDLVAVLDALGLGAVDVCGMSMGGFVAVRLAHRFPDRVRSLVLVDGGFPMAAPPGLTAEMLPAVFADRLDRLGRVWSSVAEYLDFFVDHTAPLLDRRDPLLRANLAHDLRDGRVRLSPEALLADAADVYFGDHPWAELRLPVRFLHGQWSVGADSAPGYSSALAERYASICRSTRLLAGCDHAATIMSPAGAAATGEEIMAALRSGPAEAGRPVEEG